MRRLLPAIAVIAAACALSPLPPASAASAPAAWSSVSAGRSHTCAIKPDATLWCWGGNSTGQLGIGTTSAALSPTKVGSSSWLSVASGGYHTCGIRSDHTLWCWGYNKYGELGNNSTATRLAPVRITSATNWQQISTGTAHTCAIKSDRTLWCWGSNGSGRLGDGTTTTRLTPRRITTSAWVKVAAGAAHTCGIKSTHTLWCWGSNGSGRLGDGTTTSRTTPKQITTATSWTIVATNNAHTCAVRSDHTLWCWGSNAYGQVGNGSTTNRLTPTKITSAVGWSVPAAGGYHSCAVNTSHTLWCWGLGTSGQLGDGLSQSHLRPSRNSDATNWTTVSAGTSHSCALQSDQSLWCWGVNGSGQLGDGSTTGHNSVNQVFSPEVADSGVCDPNAGASAVSLAATIDGWKTSHLMAVGQQLNINGANWNGPLTALTAAGAPQPKIVGFDFWELAHANSQRVTDLINLAHNGAILTASWHADNPALPIPQDGSNTSQTPDGKDHLADVSNPATQVGQTFTSRFNAQVVAPLQQFQTAGVPVIVRPFHEANGDWFWWGRPSTAQALAAHPAAYKALYKRAQDLTAAAGVHNVLWSYAPAPKTYDGITPVLDLLPACVDLGGLDTYDYENTNYPTGDTADHVSTVDYSTLAAAVPRMGYAEVGPFGSDGTWDPATVTKTLNDNSFYAAFAMFWFDDDFGNIGEYGGKKQISSLTGGPTWLTNCAANSGSPGMCKLNP